MDRKSIPQDDALLIREGYKPKLHRGLGFFSSFSISFSYMSVLTGIIANYGFIIEKSGAFGIWTWVLVSIGHILTALVFAEMSGRIPLTGCAYNWNSKLTNPTVGWFTGWMALLAYTVGIAAVTATIPPILRALFGDVFDESLDSYLGLALILLQALANIYGVRIAAYFNVIAVGVEIVSMIVFGGLLAWGLLSSPEPIDVTPIFQIPEKEALSLPAFLMACLLGAWTLLGFEGAADISEETVNTQQVTPKSIIRSILSCAFLGFFFIGILTIAFVSQKLPTDTPDLVNTIVAQELGTLGSKIFMATALVAVIACSLVNLTGASRLLFAMSRDKLFIGGKYFEKVSAHHVPANAIWFISLIAGSFLYLSRTVTALYGTGAVLFITFYITTVLGFAFSNKIKDFPGKFSLGIWHWPIIVISVFWLIFEIGILTIPTEFHEVAFTSIGGIAIGGIVYFLSKRNQKHITRPQ